MFFSFFFLSSRTLSFSFNYALDGFFFILSGQRLVPRPTFPRDTVQPCPDSRNRRLLRTFLRTFVRTKFDTEIYSRLTDLAAVQDGCSTHPRSLPLFYDQSSERHLHVGSFVSAPKPPSPLPSPPPPPSFVLFLRCAHSRVHDFSISPVATATVVVVVVDDDDNVLHPRATRPSNSPRGSPSFPSRRISVSVVPGTVRIRRRSDRWRVSNISGGYRTVKIREADEFGKRDASLVVPRQREKKRKGRGGKEKERQRERERPVCKIETLDPGERETRRHFL